MARLRTEITAGESAQDTGGGALKTSLLVVIIVFLLVLMGGVMGVEKKIDILLQRNCPAEVHP